MDALLGQQAEGIGIQAVGVAPATDDIKAFYPWAESVVCAAVSYLVPEAEAPTDGVHGLVARVARGADYHQVVREKLTVLAQCLDVELGAYRWEVHVDTCPLPERKLAVLSGIGWLGRNGCLYVDGFGSYVALGEIVTSAQLVPSQTYQASRCGDCRRCIDACPAKALGEDGRLDRSRCLSRITQSGEIVPDELRTILGNRIYGCDTCQEVCPHNIGVVPVNAEFQESQYPGAYPDLISLLNISVHDFRGVYRPSSIGWIGRTKLRRNAAVAAGNIGDPGAVTELRRMLTDTNSVLRSHAEWALNMICLAEASSAECLARRDPKA